MKKLGIGLAAAVLIVFAGLFALQKTTAGLTPLSDNFLKGLPVEAYYVKTTDAYEKLWNSKYRYTFTGYEKTGNKQKIVRVMDRKLRAGAYLKMYTVGTYGKGWIEIEREEVPQGALAEMK
ncbi:hypothetical protein ACH95_09570 [Bacillus glycinifermentans]|uniref:YxeA family protein n=1 Tax=Bacillus glycinifermentans TaxID=1664069 RepID=UPI0006531570|nr:YxeA family protein [Bacillus glycinifermentans]KMM60154.1 hypothetical protein ACH95_09570 [Bacillus glycinifermentans]MEC0495237.1 YxeA family protein [Bacillus glycinifermentans]MEC0542330.1 YxeA family protein [Bacillus glycinifermentans]